MAQAHGRMRISAVVLAAGAGRRFGGDKLNAGLDGKPVIRHAFDRLADFPFHEIVTVVRPGHGLHAPGSRLVVNPNAAEGMGRSLARGIDALSPADAAFVVLADMPFLPAGIFGRLAACLPGCDIAVPRHGGQAGHPVLFSSLCFDDLKTLTGDAGARSLIHSGRYRVCFLDGEPDGVLRDIDTPADLTARDR